MVAKVYLLEGIRLSDIGTRTFRVSLANAWAEVESPILGREFERGRGNGLQGAVGHSSSGHRSPYRQVKETTTRELFGGPQDSHFIDPYASAALWHQWETEKCCHLTTREGNDDPCMVDTRCLIQKTEPNNERSPYCIEITLRHTASSNALHSPFSLATSYTLTKVVVLKILNSLGGIYGWFRLPPGK